MRPHQLSTPGPRVKAGPLYFATSSSAKLIQARLFLDSLGYRVEQVEYLARAYEEPYGRPQHQLLRHALEEVLTRTRKPILVFVEDTTVRIEALSSPDDDYPGQRAKEWYLETTHEELSAELDRRGRGRRAVVKSDLALHIPGADEFVHFHGEVAGEILRTPAPPRLNPLYPWLESRDFSGWFRPDGASRALGAMSYEESLRFDFRIKALRELGRRLDEYSAVLNMPSHCVTAEPTRATDPAHTAPGADRDDLILIVVGRPGAGKTTVGRHLRLQHGFRHVESSSILLDAAAAHGCEGVIKADLAQTLFETAGYGAVEEHAVENGLLPDHAPVVYTGVRTVEGLAALMDHADRQRRPCRVVHIDVGERKAMYRYLDRARDDGDTLRLDYRTLVQRDIAFGALPYARAVSDWRIVNAKSLESLLERLNRMLASLSRGATRRDAVLRPRLTSALCHASGHKSPTWTGPNPTEWLTRRHPRLITPEGLTSRGTALHHVLHRPTEN